jgi:hypothetical protein
VRKQRKKDYETDEINETDENFSEVDGIKTR